MMESRETYQSDEEYYFYWYLKELQLNGYINNWKYQPKPFPLSDKVTFTWQKQLKTKQKIMVKTLLQDHKYQADFLIIWNKKALGVFIPSLEYEDRLVYPFYADKLSTGLYRTILDVKGTFNQNDAWRRFSIEQKWVWQRYKIMVQKVIPEKLFKETFTPVRFLKTDITGKPRKINYEPVQSLSEFISLLNE